MIEGVCVDAKRFVHNPLGWAVVGRKKGKDSSYLVMFKPEHNSEILSITDQYSQNSESGFCHGLTEGIQ